MRKGIAHLKGKEGREINRKAITNEKGMSWIVPVIVIAIIGTVIVIVVLKIPSQIGISSRISEEELKEFLKKPGQKPQNFIQELVLETKVEGSGTGIDRLVESLKSEEYKAIFETVKRGDTTRVYARMESPFKMRVFLLDNPGKENDYECKSFEEEWSCKKTIFITPEETTVNPELLKSIGEYIKNWEMGLEREGLIKVWGSRKRCANHDCICGEVDATKLAQESFSRMFGSEAQIDRYYGYVCMEEKSKIYLEGGFELKMSVATKDAKGYVVVKGGITTTRFEEVEPPLEKFKLPTEGGSSILREFESKYGYA